MIDQREDTVIDRQMPKRLQSTPQTVKWGLFDASVPAIMMVDPGEVVVVETLSGEPWDLPQDGEYEVLPEHEPVLKDCERGPGCHLVTGPIAVRGALPGNVLAVEILDIQLRQNWGWNLILPLFGTLPEDFPETVRRWLPIDRAAGTVALPWGRSLELKPFFGIMGVAPPPAWGRVTSIVPRAHGGNMDNKELRPGTTVYFPVFVEGGCFSVGDGHGVQGDGEVCVTAVETALTGTFRFSVRKDIHIAAPRAEDARQWITMGFDENLDAAAKHALRAMIAWMSEEQGLSPADAYMLCSLTADMRITQTVNGHKGVHCVMPKPAPLRTNCAGEDDACCRHS